MAKKKKTPKAKEPIRLRFKMLANGNQSIYLDFYQNGKRAYEFLKLYLVPETSEAARIQNANTLQAANAIKAQRIIDLTNGKANITDNTAKSKMLLVDWLMVYDADQKKKKGEGKHTAVTMKQLSAVLTAYRGAKTMMRDVDKAYCLGFLDYIRNEYKTKFGKPLKTVTAHNYYRCFTCALNAAVRAEIIPDNPFDKIAASDKIKAPESPREYLTIAEIKTLIATDCCNPIIKCAYLFSVYCGLRISDVESLTWRQVIMDGGECHVEIVMQKTQAPLYLPLSEEAIKWMPQRGGKSDNDRVFDLPHPNYVNVVLKKWAMAASISKNLTFHTARHTFATLMLTLGADLYTTSKLMGHKDVSTTQIYGKIIDAKKREAVNLVNGKF